MVHPALLPPMCTTQLPVVDWTDAPAGLNGLVCFAERRNLVSARAITFQTQSNFSNWQLSNTKHFSLSLSLSLSLKMCSFHFMLPWSGTMDYGLWIIWNRGVYSFWQRATPVIVGQFAGRMCPYHDKWHTWLPKLLCNVTIYIIHKSQYKGG